MTEPFDPDALDFLPYPGIGYAVPVVHEDENRWLLCDEDGDPILISSLEGVRAIAREAGIELCSLH